MNMPLDSQTPESSVRRRIGLDFDNTIVCYDRVFHAVGADLGLVPPSPLLSKDEVRNYLRNEQREHEWTKLQGMVYGSRILEATPFPGSLEFIANARALGFELFIVSHKTRTPYAGEPFDLHEAARSWLRKFSVIGPTGSISESNVFFELTLQEKLNRIATQHCDCFLDDLPELLTSPEFPPGVTRLLFDPRGQHEAVTSLVPVRSWSELSERIDAAR